MHYHYVPINQGPARTREPAPAISIEGIQIHMGTGGVGSAEEPHGLVN